MDCKLPKREQNSHKGTFGKILNIAGSKFMPGAAYLSSMAALKIGCGYNILLTTEKVRTSIKACEIVYSSWFNMKKLLQEVNVLSIGCGLSTSLFAKMIFKIAINYVANIPVIIDADGLNILSKTKIKPIDDLILTPHPAEASRLLSITIKEITEFPEKYAKEISKKYKCTTVLKGHNTVVCSNDLEIYINKTGNSSLAKSGSGDVLTGIIAGLLAQGMTCFEASKLGVYIHGLCGEYASKNLTEYSVTANDLINIIPEVIKNL